MAAIGRVLLMPKGDYSGPTIYNALDWVRDNGKAWVCKVDGTQGITPVEGANWTLLAADGSVSGTIEWTSVNNKPFNSIGSGLNVDGSYRLKLDTSYLTGSNISYDNTSSGLSATDVQEAIDEIAGSSGGGAWGSITGTLSDQTDLQDALDDKADETDLDEWFATPSTVSSGTITFNGVDDSAGTNGYEVFVNITSSSVNKNPSSEISSISGEGTASMNITYTTDADNGATAKLRILK